jgi:SagB-type dehydrogenase family enzyme
MPQIELIASAVPELSLAEALQKRVSYPHDKMGELQMPDLSDIASLLELSLRARPDGTRPYPSGGALYPIETYLIGALPGNDSPRSYHYEPESHTLADLWQLPDDCSLADIVPNLESVAPLLAVFTSLWGRNGTKYGDFGYYLGMLEAGHAAQNIVLAAAATGLHARPIGGFDDAAVARALDIDTSIEQPVYIIMIGK